MSTSLAISVLLLILGVVALIGGVTLVSRRNSRMIGVLSLVAFAGITLWALPSYFEDVKEIGLVANALSWLINNVFLAFGPYLVLIIVVLTLYAAFLFFNPHYDVDWAHGTVHRDHPTPPAPAAGAPPATPAATHRFRVQWVEGILTLALVIGEIFWVIWLFQNQPNSHLYSLIAAGQQYDAATSTETYKAYASRTGQVRAAIHMPGEFLDKGRLQTAIEEKVKRLPTGDTWKDLEVTQVNSATYISSDGETWTHVLVDYDGTLKTNIATGRNADEPIKNGSVRILNEEPNLNAKLDEWTRIILEKVAQLPSGGVTATQAPAAQRGAGFVGTDLFPTPSDFSK